MTFGRGSSKLLVVVTLLLGVPSAAVSGPAGAQSRPWTVRPVPGNGDALADLSCATGSRCVGVSAYSNQVVTTADGGASWRTFRPRGVSDFGFTSLDCVTVATCYATALLGAGANAGGALYKTADGGARWTLVVEHRAPSRPDYRFNDVACPTRTHCLVSGTDGVAGFILVVRTTTRTFSRALVPRQPRGGSILGITCVGPNVCMAAQDAGARVYRSSDGGRVWRALAVPPAFAPYESNPATPTGISSIACGSARFCVAGGFIGHLNFTGTTQPFKWVTRDAGATWSFANPFASTGARTPNAVGQNAISCASAVSCTMGLSYGLVYATSDAGRSWMWVARTPQSDYDVLSVACPSAGHCLVSAISNFPKRSVFAGTLWVER